MELVEQLLTLARAESIKEQIAHAEKLLSLDIASSSKDKIYDFIKVLEEELKNIEEHK